MTEKNDPDPSSKEARLAERLRENLRRRKATAKPSPTEKDAR